MLSVSARYGEHVFCFLELRLIYLTYGMLNGIVEQVATVVISSYRTHTVIYIRTEPGARRYVPARSWLYTCVVPVSARCANAHLLLFGGDLVPENTAFILVLLYLRGTRVVSKCKRAGPGRRRDCTTVCLWKYKCHKYFKSTSGISAPSWLPDTFL